MQQYFHPSAKLLLYTPSFAGHSFRVDQVKLVNFYQSIVVRFYFCLS